MGERIRKNNRGGRRRGSRRENESGRRGFRGVSGS